MAIEAFGVGPYTGTYDAAALGLTKDGYRFTHQVLGENIQASDVYGDTMLDGIYRGANCAIEFTCLAFTKGTPVISAVTGGLYQLHSTAAPVGRLHTDLADALVLTVVANTPAATLGPSTITASKTTLDVGYDVNYLLDSKLKELPLRLRLWPSVSTGTLTFATTT